MKARLCSQSEINIVKEDLSNFLQWQAEMRLELAGVRVKRRRI